MSASKNKSIDLHRARPSFQECCLLLGAEYVAALLENEKERATRLGKALILFSGSDAAGMKPGHAGEVWPVVFRRIIDSVVSGRTYQEQSQLMSIPIIHLDISAQEAHNIFAAATASFATVGALNEDNLSRRLFTREIFIDNEPLVIDVR